jgi:hypothetical protein
MYNNSVISLQSPICSICNLPVPLNDAKTDEDGNAVHENCYLVKLGVGKAVSSNARVSGDLLYKSRQQKQHC